MWILHCWEMKASSPAEFQKSPSVLILLDKQNIYIFTIQINFYLGILHMSCYEKREITFVLKNCSFQAWNIFLVFYSSQLVLASVGACIHKAIGPKQHYWGIDQKIKPLCMKLKSRQGPARVKLIFTIYSFKIRMLERVQPIASVPNRTARKLHQRIPKGLWPQTAELLLCFSKGVWNTSICSRVIQVLQPPISPYLQPHGTVQPRRRNGAPASHPKSGLEGRVPCAVSPWGPKRCPPLLYNPDPTAACRAFFPWGVQTHRDVSKQLTALHWNWGPYWIAGCTVCLWKTVTYVSSESDRILGDSSNLEKLELVEFAAPSASLGVLPHSFLVVRGWWADCLLFSAPPAN